MDTFHIIDDHAVILQSRGVLRQGKVYYRGKKLYAGFGSGFIQMKANGGTSVPNVSWIDTSVKFEKGEFGHPEYRKYA